jgi:hypothetical protein
MSFAEATFLPLLNFGQTDSDKPVTTSFDYVIRLQSAPGLINISGAPTRALDAALRQSLESWQARCMVLGGVIDRFKVRETYNVHYRDYLLGHLSEQEFETAAAQFAYTPQSMDAATLASNIGVLMSYTTEEFTPSDVADLFRVTTEFVDDTVSQLPLALVGGSGMQTGR